MHVIILKHNTEICMYRKYLVNIIAKETYPSQLLALLPLWNIIAEVESYREPQLIG
jgi:hypothetical protein